MIVIGSITQTAFDSMGVFVAVYTTKRDTQIEPIRTQIYTIPSPRDYRCVKQEKETLAYDVLTARSSHTTTYRHRAKRKLVPVQVTYLQTLPHVPGIVHVSHNPQPAQNCTNNIKNTHEGNTSCGIFS